MIGRYGGCFEEGIWWVYDTGEKCAVLERLAMVEGKKVRIIHGLNISHKELIYLLQKFTSPRSKVLLRMLLGQGLVGVNHRAIPTATQRMTINKYLMLQLRYIMVHHTCMLRNHKLQHKYFSIPQLLN